MESEQITERENSEFRKEARRIGNAADHGGFELKMQLTLCESGGTGKIKDG